MGPTPHGFTWRFSYYLKDLPKTTNTVWCFHAQIKDGKMDNNHSNIVNDDNNGVQNKGFSWVQCLIELRDG